MDHLIQQFEAMDCLQHAVPSERARESASSSSGKFVSEWESIPNEELEKQRIMRLHLSLLTSEPLKYQLGELTSTPIFTMPVLNHAESISLDEDSKEFPQYGLLGGLSDVLHRAGCSGDPPYLPLAQDPRVFFNVAAPSSTFICGSQGSGKSHTLSCLLENCLISSDANELPSPLSGLVFHYDTFISDAAGSPCEAAFLASNSNIKVKVLCAPTNLRSAQRTYNFGAVKVEPLEIKERDLNTKRMLDLMAVTQGDGSMPLYLHAIYRILREMRMSQQETGGSFSYDDFKSRVMATSMTPAQLAPLHQRLDTLESFMPKAHRAVFPRDAKKSYIKERGTDWTNKSGYLTIVDLSCPCVTPEGACALFNICLSIFLEQQTNGVGRIIALDEAHKYMNASAEADALTGTLLSTIRLQRHLGARIVISTQEPTISPALLDLSSVTIVHRFTSPEWLRSLKQHLAAVASDLVEEKMPQTNGDKDLDLNANEMSKGSNAMKIFSDIVKLRVGEALIFSPSAMIGLEKGADGIGAKRLGAGYLKVKIRGRVTKDGGKSLMAI